MVQSPRNPVSKACDRCRNRKTKCSGLRPCQRCTASGVQCSYLEVQRMRGPARKLQQGTAARPWEPRTREPSTIAALSPYVPSKRGAARGVSTKRRPVAATTLSRVLDLYWSRFYTVWPIVDVDDLMARIMTSDNIDDYALGLAVAAATIGRLHSVNSLPGQCPSASFCATECQRLRADPQLSSDRLGLARLSTAFFLHAYYEDLSAGSPSSLLHLREAISLAQIMKLSPDPDPDASHDVPLHEAQLRLKAYMLLFVTERGNSVFHRLPPVLPPLPIQTAFTHSLSTVACDATGLTCLANLFAEVERSGIMSIIARYGQAFFEDIKRLELLEHSLRSRVRHLIGVAECNMADIDVTTSWLRVLLWNVLHKNGFDVLVSNAELSPSSHLLDVAEDLVSTLYRHSLSDLEAHGFGMEQKIFQVALILIDNVREANQTPRYSQDDFRARAILTLKQIYQRLSSFLNGDKALLNDLFAKALEVQQGRSSCSIDAVRETGHIFPVGDSIASTQPASGDLLNHFEDWYTEISPSRDGLISSGLNELGTSQPELCPLGDINSLPYTFETDRELL